MSQTENPAPTRNRCKSGGWTKWLVENTVTYGFYRCRGEWDGPDDLRLPQPMSLACLKQLAAPNLQHRATRNRAEPKLHSKLSKDSSTRMSA